MNAEQHRGGGGGGGGERTEGYEKRMTRGHFGLIAYLILSSLSPCCHLFQQVRKLHLTVKCFLLFGKEEEELRVYDDDEDALTATVSSELWVG